MKTSEIINEIEKFAPKSLSDRYVLETGGYDNSGLLIGGEEISHEKILVCMDVLQDDIDFAVANGIKFIFSHHPYIYGKLADVNLQSPKGREIISLLKNDITVYSAHLNLDVAKNGIDDNISAILCGVENSGDVEIFHCVGESGYGKLAKREEIFAGEFEKFLQSEFHVCKSVIKQEKVNKIASFCGSGLSESEFCWGIKMGADTFVSSDIKHHLMVEAERYGVNMFDIPHGRSEFIAMQKSVKHMDFEGVEVIFQPCKNH